MVSIFLCIAVAAPVGAFPVYINEILAPVPEIHVLKPDNKWICPWISFMHSFPSTDLILSFIIFDIYRSDLRLKNHRLFKANRYMLNAGVKG